MVELTRFAVNSAEVHERESGELSIAYADTIYMTRDTGKLQLR
jgi:hypothetical protein